MIKWCRKIYFSVIGIFFILGAIGGIMKESQSEGFNDGVLVCVFVVIGIGCFIALYFVSKD